MIFRVQIFLVHINLKYVEPFDTDRKCSFDIHAGAHLLKCYFDIRAGTDLTC